MRSARCGNRDRAGRPLWTFKSMLRGRVGLATWLCQSVGAATPNPATKPQAQSRQGSDWLFLDASYAPICREGVRRSPAGKVRRQTVRIDPRPICNRRRRGHIAPPMWNRGGAWSVSRTRKWAQASSQYNRSLSTLTKRRHRRRDLTLTRRRHRRRDLTLTRRRHRRRDLTLTRRRHRRRDLTLTSADMGRQSVGERSLHLGTEWMW
jgi:hypothetical protein